MKRYIAYYRVSTKGQGESGLGLDAQKRQVAEFVRARGAEILAEYIEVESGTNDDRPQLGAALNAASLYSAPLLIAKLDRLSRSAAFLMRLQESGVQFTCVDMPDVCDMTIGVMALVARQERDAISKRTKDALAETKARGTQLGGVREGQRPPTVEERSRGGEKLKEQAKERAERYRDLIRKAVLEDECMSPAEIAKLFNANEVPTARGKTGTWQNVQVARIMKRLGMTVRNILLEETA